MDTVESLGRRAVATRYDKHARNYRAGGHPRLLIAISAGDLDELEHAVSVIEQAAIQAH